MLVRLGRGSTVIGRVTVVPDGWATRVSAVGSGRACRPEWWHETLRQPFFTPRGSVATSANVGGDRNRAEDVVHRA